MGRQHQRQGTVDKSQHRQRLSYTEKDCFEISQNYCSTGDRTAELNIHLEDPVCTKTVWRELHKSKIHDRTATAKPLIIVSNAQMRKWCQDHKTWTSDNWKHVTHPSCCSLHQEEFTFWENSRKPTIGNAWFQQWNTGEVLWWFRQHYCGVLLVPLLPFMAELLQRIIWTGWVIRCIP
jgi:hypothetical protein